MLVSLRDQDRWRKRALNKLHTLSSVTGEEAVHNVGTEVDTEAHTDDQHVHGGDVDGQAPPV